MRAAETLQRLVKRGELARLRIAPVHGSRRLIGRP